ncbi:PepSY domain-containing protein [Arenibaculum sp.]|jgi:hypothetical protein|uniref:PepSY domain-containing protein n=1 Tax=Arenibaculum sp. TaxID=2865862 RepID=UPI002E0E9422|nr:PepSY domain-containing protein [Arenibaculum sp.]
MRYPISAFAAALLMGGASVALAQTDTSSMPQGDTAGPGITGEADTTAGNSPLPSGSTTGTAGDATAGASEIPDAAAPLGTGAETAESDPLTDDAGATEPAETPDTAADIPDAALPSGTDTAESDPLMDDADTADTAASGGAGGTSPMSGDAAASGGSSGATSPTTGDTAASSGSSGTSPTSEDTAASGGASGTSPTTGDTAGAAADAPQGEETAMNEESVRVMLEAQGYQNIENVQKEGEEFTASAEKDGAERELSIDAETGEISEN